eukprot:CAMPEP_0178447950 /NCGR_PEP_ID=MMETSP0689_2-20121128/41703_1 /TAXON_ID=160604 /ORGANISM="Amphidinium massartii, Strain CS-259" /LENGTH=33 /DNA_ID= /DNA_START= /DNA_END= /DNA_ORIENTATION=
MTRHGPILAQGCWDLHPCDGEWENGHNSPRAAA